MLIAPPPRGGLLSNVEYIGMCGPKVHGFVAVLVINRVSVLVILVSNRVWFLHSSIDLGMLLRESHFKATIRPSTKDLHNALN